jgi:hypothetical protein
MTKPAVCLTQVHLWKEQVCLVLSNCMSLWPPLKAELSSYIWQYLRALGIFWDRFVEICM